VGLDEPKGKFYGGQVAAPVFKEIAEETLPMLGVFPHQKFALPLPKKQHSRHELPAEMEQQPKLAKKLHMLSLGEAVKQLHEKELIPQVTGSGLVAQTTIRPNGKIRLHLQDPPPAKPAPTDPKKKKSLTLLKNRLKNNADHPPMVPGIEPGHLWKEWFNT
ncbi:hypothetical protein ACQZV8_18330, partial [Magnetococcales bacterium HHB-1]